jgi:2-polyprenyl-6-methoxyphenol hydroxylase-like FAD-dependent oxidoreductase
LPVALFIIFVKRKCHMHILISGAGIAGLTLAYWLQRQGHHPVVIEQAPRLRDDGFMIDFFGPGYAVAERMALMEAFASIQGPISRLTFLDKHGHERIDLAYETLRSMLGGKLFSFMRGDLVRILHSAVKAEVPLHFGVSVASLRQQPSCVEVTFTNGTGGTFDLVVGADGVHSRIRHLLFGDEAQFNHFLGYYVAAFITEEALVAPDALHTLLVPRRRISICPLSRNKCATLLLYRAPHVLDTLSRRMIEHELQREFGALGWIVPDLLKQARQTEHVYIDALTQIVLPQWSKGRVVLLGDACQCVSPAAGQGASLAMAGAYMLARELTGERNPLLAFARYEHQLKPVIERKQKAGQRLARLFFAPDNHFYLTMQQLSLRMMMCSLTAPLIKRNFAWNEQLGL